jgi:lysyl-tRNA synthetase class 1
MHMIHPHASTARAWPFAEAQALLKRMETLPNDKGYVLFETGYGPSGLPHMGTFGEVARTSMVRHAFTQLSDMPTQLFTISDDMDGLRKVPENIPNPDMVAEHMGKPLTSVPDPFGTHESFGAHMNARLCAFLDRFGFDYTFKSSTEAYKSGVYNEALLTLLARYERVMKVMLPTLGEERQRTYSPFLPVSPRSGKVLLAKVHEVHVEKGTIVYEEEDGSKEEVPVTDGHCKLQWKPDMGMRWAAWGVDYEMYGKDHLVSAKLYDAICRIAGGTPPQQMMFELFLDEKGEKISKSKGNGLTIDEWLTYGPTESLAHYMFQSPRKAKKLHFDVIPKAVDEYQTFLSKYHALPDGDAAQLENAAYHVHGGDMPAEEPVTIPFSLLLNLAAACNPEDKTVLWGFISRYAEGASPETCPMLDALAGYAVRYYHDFVKPNKSFRDATDTERNALTQLRSYLHALAANPSAEDAQDKIYEIGREYYGKDAMREWFKAMYEVLLGQSQGPRMGSFIALFGAKETVALIDEALARNSQAA